MRFSLSRNIVVSFLSLVAMLMFSASCGSKIENDGNVVFTQVPVNEVEEVAIESGSFRYAPSMKIALAEMGESMEVMEVLTPDFYSARSPEISFDGLQIVFSGQLNEGDVWQIWTMDIKSRAYAQVTQCDMNCTDPTWLPGERIAFSKLVKENDLEEHHALFTIGDDGCCEQRITFQPHNDLNASVMHDGRILASSQQVYPEAGSVKYLAMRPDGTKAELFYLADDASQISKAEEDGYGKVLFAKSGVLNSVSFSRPLHTKSIIQEAGSIQSVFPIENRKILVSIKKPGKRSFGLALIGNKDSNEGAFYFNEAEYHAIEPVVIHQRPIPRNLPTRVNTEKETGYFVCMDANESEMAPAAEAGEASKIQVLGLNNMIGETEVAEDGSFYLELKADQPVRFQTLNDSGDVLRGPSSWMWVRPNERRGCVGCHEDRELTPENVVPLAIEKAPVAMIK
jgi:hypothetical protein